MSKPLSKIRKAASPTLSVPTTTIALEIGSKNPIDSIRQFNSPNRAKGMVIPPVNLKKIQDTQHVIGNTWNYFDQTGTNVSTTESSMVSGPITCETARKHVMVLGYTNKLKNQKRLNEIYSTERLMEKNYIEYGLSPRKFASNSKGLTIRAEIADDSKQLKMISPSNLLSNKTVKKTHIAANLDTRTSQASDRTPRLEGKSISDLDYQNFSAKGKVLTNEAHGEKRIIASSQKRDDIISSKNKEEQDIKELNMRIRNTIQNGLSTQTTPAFDSFLSRTKTKLTVKRKTERASILVLFDHDLEFIKDYLVEYQLSLRLAFDKLEDYGSPTHRTGEERHDGPLKKGTYLPHHCIFVFLKCSPKVNTRSFEILQDLIKRKCCYVIKCALPSDKVKLNLNYQDEDIDDEWKKKQESTLTMTSTRFGVYSIDFIQFNALKEFVVTNAKPYLE